MTPETEKMVMHTPTPWAVDTSGLDVWIAQDHGEGGLRGVIAFVSKADPLGTQEANAAFIVRAVNEYAGNQATIKWLEEHKAAGERCRSELNEILTWMETIGKWSDDAAIGKAVRIKLERLAAIAKAEGR